MGATTNFISELLTDGGTTWNEEALHHNLIFLDVEAAKCIPLGQVHEDLLGMDWGATWSLHY
jgi:hypothetical protein